MLSGSQHSGTAEEDFSITHDLDNSKGDLNNSVDQDRDTDDEERIDFQCTVCERQFQDLDQ